MNNKKEPFDIPMHCPECDWKGDLSDAEFHAGLEICPVCREPLEYTDIDEK